jgi:hypothetical protein
MPDSFSIVVDTKPVLAALAELPDQVLAAVLAACKETADAIVIDAHARAARAFVSRTGVTLAGIGAEPEPEGNGYRVVDRNPRMPELPLWLEKGTHLGSRVHVQPRDFFYVAAALQAGAHERRVAQAVADALEEAGLGS